MNSFFADMKHSEIQVANFLKELGLHWIYESPVFIHDEENRPRVWTPAFFIPELGMYIEVCGGGKPINYEYRQKIYRKNGVCHFCPFLQGTEGLEKEEMEKLHIEKNKGNRREKTR